MATRSRLRHRSPQIGLLLLSVLWAASTLRPDILPNLIPEDPTPLLETAKLFLPCALLAITTVGAALVRRDQWPSRHDLWQPILTGLGLFIVPSLLISLSGFYSGDSVGSYTRTILFALIPIFCLILEPYINPASLASARLSLPAALFAIFGATCIFPVVLPYSLSSTIGFSAASLAALSIAAAGCLGTRVTATNATFPFAAISALTATAVFAITGLLHSSPFWTWRYTFPAFLWTSAIDLPALLLLFALFRHLSASSLATRYLFSPLIAILVGAALLHLSLTPRTSFGLVLMTAGSIYLLFAPTTEPDSIQLSLK